MRRNMRPPPREEGRIINRAIHVTKSVQINNHPHFSFLSRLSKTILNELLAKRFYLSSNVNLTLSEAHSQYNRLVLDYVQTLHKISQSFNQ